MDSEPKLSARSKKPVSLASMGRASKLNWALMAASAAALAACGTTQTSSNYPPPPGPTEPLPSTQVQTREGITPSFMAGRPVVRIGLLLPFTLRPQDASSLYSAAELALFDHGNQNTLLIPRDAGSNEAEAQAAAHALVNDGADIIIGPVLREGVAGAADEARSQNIPVIGFSSDRTVAGNGVYLLSFQLEDEIQRIVSFAASRNMRTIALLAPNNEYGRRVEQALRQEAARSGVAITNVELYARNDGEALAAAMRMGSAATVSPPQALLIADGGTILRSIGSGLAQGNMPRSVKLLGTSAWAGGDADREPALAGGWYVSSDPAVRADFENRYQAAYQRAPSRLSSLAYDAVALSALLSRDRGGQGFTRSALENSDGFLGSDGVFRFGANGAIQRGLAVLEAHAGGSTVVDPAPRRFSGPGS